MASRRMIASDIWRDDFIYSLDMFGRLLWIGLIVTCADDQGRFVNNSRLIHSDVFPLDNIPESDIDKNLSAFAAAGKLVMYESDGKQLIQIVNWWEYQTPSWAAPSKYPAPQGWTDRVKVHGKGTSVTVLNWDKPGGYTADIPNQLPNPLPIGINDGDVKGEGNGNGKKGGADAPFSEEGRKPNFSNPMWDMLHGINPSGPCEPPLPDTTWVPDDIQDLALEFMLSTNLPPPPDKSTRGYWISELRKLRLDYSLTPADIKRGVLKMRDMGGLIKSPESIKTAALDTKAANTFHAAETW